MIKINFKLVCSVIYGIIYLHLSHQSQVFKECFSTCLYPVDQFSRDDEQVQAAPYIHQKCCHQELLRKVHQLYSGLHLYL